MIRSIQQRFPGTVDADAYGRITSPGAIVPLEACGILGGRILAVGVATDPLTSGAGVWVDVGVCHPDGWQSGEYWGIRIARVAVTANEAAPGVVLPYPLPIPVVDGRVGAVYTHAKKGGVQNDLVTTWILEVP